MGYTIKGCGTMFCGGRGHVSWGGTPDSDGLECFCLFYLPVVPYRAVHAYEWQHSSWWEVQRASYYKALPIRWSADLVVRTLVRHWLAVPLLAGIMLAFVLLAPTEWEVRLAMGGGGVLVIAACLVWWGTLAFLDRRNRDLRRVLGPDNPGSSDPATWTDDHLATVRRPRKLFGTASYADAVESLLDDGEFARAMLAARLTVALEDRAHGEELTDLVLRDPDVRAALRKVKRSPKCWYRAMNAGAAHSR